MRRILQFILAALVAAMVSGCASVGDYWKDRGRDAADIFTVTGGLGVGAKARVGPVGTGLLLQSDMAGVRGGSIEKPSYDSFDVTLLCVGVECFDLAEFNIERESKDYRGKSFSADNECGLCFPRNKFSISEMSERFYHTKWPYYTHIEAVAALGPSVRLGFNPGELLDFLLGFAKVDIADDDTAAQLREKARPRPKAYPECAPQPSDEVKKFEERMRKEHPE